VLRRFCFSCYLHTCAPSNFFVFPICARFLLQFSVCDQNYVTVRYTVEEICSHANNSICTKLIDLEMMVTSNIFLVFFYFQCCTSYGNRLFTALHANALSISTPHVNAIREWFTFEWLKHAKYV